MELEYDFKHNEKQKNRSLTRCQKVSEYSFYLEQSLILLFIYILLLFPVCGFYTPILS